MSSRLAQNPVHPLDLSLNSLMVIYKKFEEAKRLSGNPNQQLPIDLLVQLISRLIDHEPSLLQKELSKSMYKKTISWNEFLNFLDQQSEARQNILDWIMYQMNIRQFKLHRQVNVKFLGHFDEISYYRPIMINGKSHTLMLLDKEKFVLHDSLTEQLVTQLKIKREKQIFEEERPNTSMLFADKSRKGGLNTATRYVRRSKGRHSDISLPIESTQFSPKQKLNHPNKTHERGKGTVTISEQSNIIDEDAYILQQRKKIGFVFDIFKQLPAQSSNQFADFVSNKITQRKLGDVSVHDLKDNYKQFLNKKIDSKDLGENQHLNRLANIKEIMKKIQDDKRKLSYNPLRQARPASNPLAGRFEMDKKRISFEKKERQNDLGIRTLTFLEKHQLIAVALYNFDLVLVQITKEFNKIQFTQQDRIKVPKQIDRKKNEVIEKVVFHFHQIFKRYQILVLIRVEGYSYIRCFNLLEVQGKKGQYFQLSKQVFSFHLNFEVVNMVAEEDFGFHIVGDGGLYKSYKDDLTLNNQHYTLHHSQKFKSEMVISCMTVSKIKRKIMFGTVGGLVCFYDCFSKQMIMMKKVSSKSVLKVIFDDSCSQALIFSADEVLTVYDTNKLEEIQVISVKNEQRLNQKVTMFNLSHEKGEAVLSFYGSEFRQFISYVDEDRNNRKRKMECTYQWRLNRMGNNEGDSPCKAPVSIKTSAPLLPEEITEVIQTDKYFVTMSNQLEFKLYSRKSYKIKFSFILTLKSQQSLIGFNISHDAKILVYSTQDQRLHIINVYTEEVYQTVHIQQKILYMQFLSERNEYFLVTGSECGKISFIPSYLSQGKLANKILQVHRKPVTMMVTVGEYLITTGEEGLIVIWQMPFNIIKFEINLAERRPREFVIDISPTRNPRRVVCRTAYGMIYEINAKEGVIKDINQELSVVNILTSCFNEETNELYVLDEDLKFTVFEGIQDESTAQRSRSYVPPERSTIRKTLNRKEPKAPPLKRRSELSHPAQIQSKWKIKSIHNIKQKGVQSARIIPNQMLNSTILFLSKDYFYIYDQLDDRFRGRYCYSNGEFIKHDPKLTTVHKSTMNKF